MKEDKPQARGDRRDAPGRLAERVATHSAATAASAVGGAAAGAAAGTAFGPVGSLAGAAAGALAGAAAGAATGPGAAFDTAPFEAYWRQHFASRPYVPAGARYDDYGPVYRYAIREYAATDHPRTWEETSYRLRRGWQDACGGSCLSWDEAMPAARDAWMRMYDPQGFV